MNGLKLVEFIDTWLKRAKRGEEFIDEGDRFVSLWIAFNAWLKSEYSETATDYELIEQVKVNKKLKLIFDELKKTSGYSEILSRLEGRCVYNAKYPNDRTKDKVYNGSFNSLIAVLYQIRCNLFHGRKNIEEKDEYKLVSKAKDVLLPLFSEYKRKFL